MNMQSLPQLIPPQSWESRRGEFIISPTAHASTSTSSINFSRIVLTGQGNSTRLRGAVDPAFIVLWHLWWSGAQVGFARVISDFATYAYIADVFVVESHRGHGLGKFMMQCIVQHPALQGMRRWEFDHARCPSALCTGRIYAAEDPERYMEIQQVNM